MRVERKFHPVGQGAFNTERFYDGEENIFNVVYDCGTLSSKKSLIKAIQTEFNNGYSCSEDRPIIDILFISHLHRDHISGIIELQNCCTIKKVVVPELTNDAIIGYYLSNIIDLGWNLKTLTAVFQALFKMELLEYTETESERVKTNKNQLFLRFDHWVFRPIYIPLNHSKLSDELKKLGFISLVLALNNQEFSVAEEEIKRIFKSENETKKLKKCYEVATKGFNFHRIMLPVYSGISNPACIIKKKQNVPDEKNCLYLGDYIADNQNSVSFLKKELKKYWDVIGTLQVPHHGSKENNCQDLYEREFVSVISADLNYTYHHPDKESLIYMLNSRSTIILVNKNRDYAKEFKI